MNMQARRLPAALTRIAAIALVVALGACTELPNNKQISLQLPQLPKLPQAAQIRKPTPEEREHARILATYGGAYENERLHADITRLVKRLVAASERPDQKYEVTLLNSPAINAFALPNGHLYVTRGLIALANDKSELASVLAHEMAT
jgi:predicted Zn-dependent protease